VERLLQSPLQARLPGEIRRADFSRFNSKEIARWTKFREPKVIDLFYLLAQVAFTGRFRRATTKRLRARSRFQGPSIGSLLYLGSCKPFV